MTLVYLSEKKRGEKNIEPHELIYPLVLGKKKVSLEVGDTMKREDFLEGKLHYVKNIYFFFVFEG